MLGSKELAEEVGSFLKSLSPGPWVVMDPVMISTSGHKLINDEARQAMIEHLFPFADILTRNKYEAEDLLGRKLNSTQDVEQGTNGYFCCCCCCLEGKKSKTRFSLISLSLSLPISFSFALVAGARDLLEMGVKAVLIKGGHMLDECNENDPMSPDVNATKGYAQDYFLSKEDLGSPEELPRLCDGTKGLWLRTSR